MIEHIHSENPNVNPIHKLYFLFLIFVPFIDAICKEIDICSFQWSMRFLKQNSFIDDDSNDGDDDYC